MKYANHFDIDWHPADPALRGKLASGERLPGDWRLEGTEDQLMLYQTLLGARRGSR